MAGIEYVDFTEETFPLARELAVSRFGEGVEPLLRRILTNPARRLLAPAGCLAIREGRAVCLIASIVRRMYFGQEEGLGYAVGFLCKEKHTCPHALVTEVVRHAGWERPPCRLCFGNTAIFASRRLFDEIGAHSGPGSSWSEMRFGVIHPLRFLALLLRRKLFHLGQPKAAPPAPPAKGSRAYAAAGGLTVRRLAGFDGRLEEFWSRYLARNRGVVLSRDRESMEWFFGADLTAGRSVLLALLDGEAAEGFLVLSPMRGSPYRWRIMDMLALENDLGRVDLLLRGARRFLKRETAAITLESAGFPDFIQPLLAKHLPYRRSEGHDHFVWIAREPVVEELVAKVGNTPESWFFGPFDGDYCLL